MVNRITVSVDDEVRNTVRAIERVTSAIFAGQPGTASKIRGKRKNAQFTFKANSKKDKDVIEADASAQILEYVFSNNAAQLESIIESALERVVNGLVGIGNSNITILGTSLGTVNPKKKIENYPFARYIKSKQGAGEVGLPDPEEAIRNLKIALVGSITASVIVRHDGPQIKFEFDQRRLLRLTPHPDRFEGGGVAPFFSWLSLITGPDFVQAIQGYSIIRASDIKAQMRSVRGKLRSNRTSTVRSLRALEGLLKLSRTEGNAGDFAAIMLSNRAKRAGGRSPAEFAGGSGKTYSPSKNFDGFWDIWWSETKLDLGKWTRQVVSAAIRGILKG